MNGLKQKLSEYSKELGFSKIGFAAPDVPDEVIRKYWNWLAKGYNYDMDYLAENIDKRANPDLLLPGVKTIIMLAQSYNTPFVHPKDFNPKEEGKISRYAWGGDYHEIVKKKLKKFVKKIEEIAPGSENRYFTDSGPVLEKYWARRSGIGWQGKNSVIITKEYGSFIFLGTVLTTLHIKPDSGAKDLCGKCEICLKACPTEAIESPGVLNPGKCISYWTIEVKRDKEIPEEIASNARGWIFGCDICQEVCPWNKSAPDSGPPEFEPRNGETTVNFSEIMNMSEEEFMERFKKSPVKRLGLDGLKRNIRDICIKK